MKTLPVSEARNNLPGLLDELVRSREPVLVTRRGKPVARILPVSAATAQTERHPLRHVAIRMAADFNAPLAELWAALPS